MSLRSDPLAALVVPDGTTVEEHAIVTDRDVIVGTQSEIALGVRGRNVIAGERVTIAGDVEADADCRLDTWCEIGGNVLAGADAYIGERVTIDGQLVVAGDLDIGDDVTIEEGFDANGWIVIRNPVPTLVFLFTYLTHLLHIGEEDMAEDVVSEVFDEGDGEPLVIPRNADVTDDAWRVSTPAEVGTDCRLHGNLRAASITVGERTEIFGSLRARESITIESGTTVHGDVTTRGGAVEVAADAQVRGDIACEQLRLHEGAVVEGAMRARGEMTIVREGNPLTTAPGSAAEANDEVPDPAENDRGERIGEDGPSEDAGMEASDPDDSEDSDEPTEDVDRTEPIPAIEAIDTRANTENIADEDGSESSTEGKSVAADNGEADAADEEPPEPVIREAEPEASEPAEPAVDDPEGAEESETRDPEESEEPKGSFTPPE
ncbi:polymer-forming cytoskeletal protein [Halococcus saccharolyticus]|uniref:Acyltransferase n=1 Tax=Halococcus saccharolyticus DSM 5350 TaxID=1227455 RepID=M0MJC4_9EURY|nr:polymer-forming cytoskeletal protein [Halococcus saccharolyticus]EMA45458.1 hypothetical protein C449_07545 [Halococcus saccharolyticus DSM 5350]